jgi:hypothetical protein
MGYNTVLCVEFEIQTEKDYCKGKKRRTYEEVVCWGTECKNRATITRLRRSVAAKTNSFVPKTQDTFPVPALQATFSLTPSSLETTV